MRCSELRLPWTRCRSSYSSPLLTIFLPKLTKYGVYPVLSCTFVRIAFAIWWTDSSQSLWSRLWFNEHRIAVTITRLTRSVGLGAG
ncbi:AAEL012667-PA [Aedes aegypti]|uniref:AAEL012667-PA n=1 Tax=Aedes aegypti TaxID=7159 RepID=Q16LF3_AEDAE|nr:AAEL012667-PA [Aedes aegypti]